MNQITTITFFKFDTLRRKWWGFKMMNEGHQRLVGVRGLQFYKLMGSGRGKGFNPFPDWSVYVLLQIWDNEADAAEFLNTSALMQDYRQNSHENWTLYLKNIVAKGSWAGGNPFEISGDLDPKIPFLAIITRATIKPKRLISFWRYVPTSQRPLEKMDGLLFTKGIGEFPILQMATFSIWKDLNALKSFAYRSPEHQKAIEMTRKLDWYSEELFARFQPYRSVGTWEGQEWNFF